MNPEVVRESTLLGNQKHKRHFAEPAPCHRGRSDHNRRGYVRWPQELTLKTSGKASQGRGSGSDIPRASFLIWSTI